MENVRKQVLVWLNEWQSLITKGDFDTARALFDPSVMAFGTVTIKAQGLDALVQDQWKQVWTRTQNFVFDPDSVSLWSDGGLVTLAVLWSSRGRDAGSGEVFERAGRATIVLLMRAGMLRAVHTHFSINPAAERFLPG